MTEPFASMGEDRAEREGPYAEGRRADRTYVSKSFSLAGSPGVPARFVYKVFDPESETDLDVGVDGAEWLVHASPQGRVQVKLLIAREAGHVSDLWVQRLKYSARGVPRAEHVLGLHVDDARRLVELLRNLDHVPVEGEESIRFDDALLNDVLSSRESVARLYATDPDLFRRLISDDAAQRDVIALKRRRAEVERFRTLMSDADAFDAAVQDAPGRKPEAVWQRFFEDNPWILGAGLGAQLYTSWSPDRLEQVVGGPSIAREGKRADAIMRTSGVVRWMTFAEFKTHRTDLLAGRYRSGVFPPSDELVAGIAQSQATVRRALEDIGEALRERADDGSEIPNEVTFLMRPRSYLIIGKLDEFLGEEGGPHVPKIRSFELFRRSLVEPEVVTFDELLARAEWLVSVEEPA
ncbi:MAG TPA: Shedu immune nuclease family protein [Candidatus Saccharimonadales bacterium]|nr:Shedu immune nuclease family protein [Candidatus Saccharimonadales bacterium]